MTDVFGSTVFHRYVALGDSFTEGVGDPDPSLPNGVRGWADRVAEVLAAHAEDFGYANLAIRGRLMREVLDTQIEPALDLRPDLVSLYAGGNDLLRPRVDIDLLLTTYEAAAARLVSTGAHLVLFTGFDLGHAPVFRHLRGRVAVYNEFVREIADRHDASLIDFWRLRDYRDPRLWSADRLHMSTAGHTRMAVNVLDRLGVEHNLALEPLPERPVQTRREERAATREWAREHLAPWVQRRLRGASSGDGVPARRPTLRRP